MARYLKIWGMICLLAGMVVCPAYGAVADKAPAGSTARTVGKNATGKNAGAAPAGQNKGGKQAAQKKGPVTLDPALFTAVKLPVASQEELTVLRDSAAAYGKGDYAKAVSLLTPAAEKGSARAAFSLGLMAMRGHGMPLSTENAEKWWIRSARGGFPDAQYHLGFMHHRSLRGPRNPELVAKLWSLAAAQGQGDAMYWLGFLYRSGDGVAKDAKKSLKMFTDAANLGHPGAAYEVGLLYKYGRGGVTKNTAKAKQLLQKAAAAGSVQARQELTGM